MKSFLHTKWPGPSALSGNKMTQEWKTNGVGHQSGQTRVKYGNWICTKMIMTFNPYTSTWRCARDYPKCLPYINTFSSPNNPLNASMPTLQLRNGHREVGDCPRSHSWDGTTRCEPARRSGSPASQLASQTASETCCGLCSTIHQTLHGGGKETTIKGLPGTLKYACVRAVQVITVLTHS